MAVALEEKQQLHEIKLTVPSDIFLTLNQSEKEFTHNIKVSVAIRLFQKQKLTLGKAAQLAGLSRYAFENTLTENNVPISTLSFEDISKDAQKFK